MHKDWVRIAQAVTFAVFCAGIAIVAQDLPGTGEIAADDGNSSLPFWMDVYSEGGTEPSENDNLYGYGEVKAGKRFDIYFPLDVYGKVRLERDRDRYFWHNREDIGLGSRIHLLTKWASLYLMVEGTLGRFVPDPDIATSFEGAGRALSSVNAQNALLEEQKQEAFLLGLTSGNMEEFSRISDSLEANQAYAERLSGLRDSLMSITSGRVSDIRAGFVFWKGWGRDGVSPSRLFPLRFWGDCYGDLIFLSSLRSYQIRGEDSVYVPSPYRYSNLIFAVTPKIGLVLVEGFLGSVVGYGEAACLVDFRGDWYNNLGSCAGGLRYMPFHSVDLVLYGEYTMGAYLGRQYRDEVNPNKQTFANTRFGLTFWYGLGL